MTLTKAPPVLRVAGLRKVYGDNVVLETTSVATAFRFLDDAERKQIAEEKAKAAKAKR